MNIEWIQYRVILHTQYIEKHHEYNAILHAQYIEKHHEYKNNVTDTNYFITFLQNTDEGKLLLVFI